MNRPFNYLCISVILGIIIGSIFHIFIDGYLLIGLLSLLLLCIVFFPKYSLAYVGISFILLSNYNFFYHTKDISILHSYTGKHLVLEGRIQGIGIQREGYQEYDMKVFHLITTDKVIGINEKTKIQIKNCNTLETSLKPGDGLILKKALLVEDFSENTLTGYQVYLRGKGIKNILKVDAKDIIIKNSNSWNLAKGSYKTKKYIEDFFDESLQSVQSSLIKSIAFGNQGYLDKDSLSLFSITGTAHIIAVSGLHVGVLVLIIHCVLKKLNMGKNQVLLTTMIILFLYAYMVGFPVSIIRANWMYYLYVGGYFLERRYDAINSLMLMAFVLLLYNPFTLFSVSFQLSFAATLSILLFYPILKGYLKILPKSLQSLLGVTIAAQLGTIPIMIYHFGQVSIVSPLANIFIVPTLVPLLSMGFFSVITSVFSRNLGYAINFITNGLLTYIYRAIEICSKWKFANKEIKDINYFYIILYYLILFITYFILRRKHRNQNRFILEKE